MTYSSVAPERPHVPLRVLFLGRIMAYKGLPLLIEAVEKLRTEGMPVSLGVAGEGDIADSCRGSRHSAPRSSTNG